MILGKIRSGSLVSSAMFTESSKPTIAKKASAVAAVTAPKAARIRRLAQRWLAARHAGGGGGFVEVRFDVLAVLLVGGAAPRVEHYEGAF